MIQENNTFLGRFESSFNIMKTNVALFVAPVFLFQLIFHVLLPLFFTTFFMSYVDIWSWELGAIDQKNSFYISFALTLGLFFFILYVSILVPLNIYLIYITKNLIHKKTVNFKESFIFSIKNIWNIFNTYWYIFAYTLLIPSLLFITWGILFVCTLLFPSIDYIGVIKNISYLFIGLSVIIGLYFLIYRGIRSTFWLYNAIDKNIYSKDNFKESLKYTKNKWWCIFKNLFLLSMLISLISWVVQSFIKVLLPVQSDYSIFLSGEYKNPEILIQYIQQSTHFSIISFLKKILETWVSSIAFSLTIIFMYLLFVYLKQELDNRAQTDDL